jgi:exodeoxyribonuclease V gamma subunit
MVSVLNSRRLGVLADLRAQRACQPPNSSAVPETVLVQSLGITRWLSCCLADGLDGDVRVHFPFSATCIWELFECVRLNVPETSLFSSDVLTWRAGLNRLLVGDALRGLNTRVFAENPPDDMVETGKARVLRWLHAFTEAAFDLIAPLCDRRPGSAWLNTGLSSTSGFSRLMQGKTPMPRPFSRPSPTLAMTPPTLALPGRCHWTCSRPV